MAFLLILFLPAINASLGIWKFERKDENRRFSDSLHVDINQLDRFPGEAEAFLNDNFPFRTPLLDAYHSMKYHWYKVSPHPDKTIIGRNGWFFMAGDEKDIFEGRRDFDSTRLAEFEQKWHQRIQYFDSLGIKAYWLICPFKHYVYPEKLPFNVYQSKPRRVDVLKEHLAQTVPGLTVVDPLERLRAEKENKRLYYLMDNHWNFSAGEVVSSVLMEHIRKDFPDSSFLPLPDYSWKDSIIQNGIHRRVVAQHDLYETARFPFLEGAHASRSEGYGFPVQKGFPYPDQYEICYSNKASGARKRVLFIRDSFTDHLIPFISEPFKETVYIFDFWEYKRNPEIVEKVRPDIIIYSSLETHIEQLLDHD